MDRRIARALRNEPYREEFRALLLLCHINNEELRRDIIRQRLPSLRVLIENVRQFMCVGRDDEQDERLRTKKYMVTYFTTHTKLVLGLSIVLRFKAEQVEINFERFLDHSLVEYRRLRVITPSELFATPPPSPSPLRRSLSSVSPLSSSSSSAISLSRLRLDSPSVSPIRRSARRRLHYTTPNTTIATEVNDVPSFEGVSGDLSWRDLREAFQRGINDNSRRRQVTLEEDQMSLSINSQDLRFQRDYFNDAVRFGDQAWMAEDDLTGFGTPGIDPTRPQTFVDLAAPLASSECAARDPESMRNVPLIIEIPNEEQPFPPRDSLKRAAEVEFNKDATRRPFVYQSKSDVPSSQGVAQSSPKPGGPTISEVFPEQLSPILPPATLSQPSSSLPPKSSPSCFVSWTSIQAGSSVSAQPMPVTTFQLHLSAAIPPQADSLFQPRPGGSFEPRPGPSREPQPGPSSEPQPGPSYEPRPGPSTEPQPGPSSEPQPGTSQPQHQAFPDFIPSWDLSYIPEPDNPSEVYIEQQRLYRMFTTIPRDFDDTDIMPPPPEPPRQRQPRRRRVPPMAVHRLHKKTPRIEIPESVFVRRDHNRTFRIRRGARAMGNNRVFKPESAPREINLDNPYEGVRGRPRRSCSPVVDPSGVFQELESPPESEEDSDLDSTLIELNLSDSDSDSPVEADSDSSWETIESENSVERRLRLHNERRVEKRKSDPKDDDQRVIDQRTMIYDEGWPLRPLDRKFLYIELDNEFDPEEFPEFPKKFRYRRAPVLSYALLMWYPDWHIRRHPDEEQMIQLPPLPPLPGVGESVQPTIVTGEATGVQATTPSSAFKTPGDPMATGSVKSAVPSAGQPTGSDLEPITISLPVPGSAKSMRPSRGPISGSDVESITISLGNLRIQTRVSGASTDTKKWVESTSGRALPPLIEDQTISTVQQHQGGEQMVGGAVAEPVAEAGAPPPPGAEAAPPQPPPGAGAAPPQPPPGAGAAPPQPAEFQFAVPAPVVRPKRSVRVHPIYRDFFVGDDYGDDDDDDEPPRRRRRRRPRRVPQNQDDHRPREPADDALGAVGPREPVDDALGAVGPREPADDALGAMGPCEPADEAMEGIGAAAIPVDGVPMLAFEPPPTPEKKMWDEPSVRRVLRTLMMESGERVVRFSDICQPGICSRISAASFFSILLVMEAQKVISLRQRDMSGDPYEIMIVGADPDVDILDIL